MSFPHKSAANISDFYDHDLQSIMALFLLNRELYKDYALHRDRQGYFFSRFRTFADKYYQLTVEREPDACVYFMSTRKECAGESNICGGAGKMTHSAAKGFKTAHKLSESSRAERIDHFAKKYQVVFDQPGKEDPRLFLGVKEIWNKLDCAIEIVTASKWAYVSSRSYDDETLLSPLPTNLDKLLVPLSIRNRVVQKHKNAQRTISSSYSAKPKKSYEDEDEDLALTTCNKPPAATSNLVVFVPPPELDSEDW